MSHDELIGEVATLIEFAGSVMIAVACLRGLCVMTVGRGTHEVIVRGRLIVAEGMSAALGYKTASTLLKIIELRTWTAIGMFAAVLTLRTFIKRVLASEEVRLRQIDGHS